MGRAIGVGDGDGTGAGDAPVPADQGDHCVVQPFSPTGPAPMMTTSKMECWLVVVISVRLRGEAVQPDRGDQEEDAAQDRVAGDAGE